MKFFWLWPWWRSARAPHSSGDSPRAPRPTASPPPLAARPPTRRKSGSWPAWETEPTPTASAGSGGATVISPAETFLSPVAGPSSAPAIRDCIKPDGRAPLPMRFRCRPAITKCASTLRRRSTAKIMWPAAARPAAFLRCLPMGARSCTSSISSARWEPARRTSGLSKPSLQPPPARCTSSPTPHQWDSAGEGGASAANIRAFKDISPAADGKLHLKFDAVTNPAIVNGIEITPGTSGQLRPIRMVSRDHPYTDRQGRVWESDQYSRGGQLVQRTEPIANADDPDVLRGERYGNLRYVIPVPRGRYGGTLYFVEAWFGPGKFAGGGIGSRTFDILGNGVALRRGFDIFKEARGSDRAVTFSTHGLEPDAQGKLTISLAPLRNYASLNAIEVVDESK